MADGSQLYPKAIQMITRNAWFTCLTITLAWAAFFERRAAMAAPEARSAILVYIGTYTGPKSEGIYVARLDPVTGELTQPLLACNMPNPSFLDISRDHKFLFACGEYGPFKAGSAITSFAIKPDGTLEKLSEQPAGGNGPCHVIVDDATKVVLVANYGSGSVAALKVDGEGKLSPPAWVDQHAGDDARQSPHAHCWAMDKANRFALCCDLGLDRVYVYKFDAGNGTLAPGVPPTALLPPGSGPRHLVFSPDEKFVYTINELGSTVTAFTWDDEHGVLHDIQTISTLPPRFSGKRNSTAEIAIHPGGKFLYGSNRGDDSIAEYAVDTATGKLTLIGHVKTGGKMPRGFGVDPTGQWLIAGNQGSNSLVEFKIDQKTGELSPTGTRYELGMPVCVKFMEQK